MKYSTAVVMAILAYAFAAAVALLDQLNGTAGLAGFVREYQTLIAGSFALVSVVYLAQQIRLQREQQELQLRLATRSETDALDVAMAHTEVVGPVFMEHDGVTSGVLDLIGPNEFAVEFVRSKTLPAIADQLHVLAHGINGFNDILYAPDSKLDADTLARLRSRLRMIDQMRRRLKGLVEARRSALKLATPGH